MACNGLSTISGSDYRFFCPSTPPISSIKSLKFSSVRFPSRSASFRLKALSIAEPSFSSSPWPFSSFQSFYELLGIPETGSLLEIKQAYKQLARKYHPDLSPPGRVNDFTKMFILVHEAYETLSDPIRRAMYDRDIARGLGHSSGGSCNDDEMSELKNEWKARWEAQLSELKNRTYKYGNRAQSWASRTRQMRDEVYN